MERTIVTKTYETHIKQYGSELSLEYEDDIISTAIFLYDMNASYGDEMDVPVVLCRDGDETGTYYWCEGSDTSNIDLEVEQYVVHVRASQHRM